MIQSYPDPWMDRYWNLRHLLLDIAHLGRDELLKVADIMDMKFSKGENWPNEMFDTLYDNIMDSMRGGWNDKYLEMIEALVQTIKEQITSLANVSGAVHLVKVLEDVVSDLEKELSH